MHIIPNMINGSISKIKKEELCQISVILYLRFIWWIWILFEVYDIMYILFHGRFRFRKNFHLRMFRRVHISTLSMMSTERVAQKIPFWIPQLFIDAIFDIFSIVNFLEFFSVSFKYIRFLPWTASKEIVLYFVSYKIDLRSIKRICK